MLYRYGPFVYMSEEEELEMAFQDLESRPMVRLDNGSCYVGEWRMGTKIREGKGV